MVAPVVVDPGAAGLVRLGLVAVDGIVTAGADPVALDAELAGAVAALRGEFGGRAAGEIPRLAPARELYRAIGLDPTKRRPSPEALTRRLLRGDPFPRVHPAVDLGNLWAILHGLPVGLYDRAALAPPVTLRLGAPGESYAGIRKDEVHLEGRLLLADTRGPFGNPSADSLRTSVTEASRDLLYVLFAPASFDARESTTWQEWLRAAAERLLGGTARIVQ